MEDARESWQFIQERDSDCTVFQSYFWMESWVISYLTVEQLLIFVETENGKPISLMACMVHEDTLKYLSYNCSDYAGIICLDEFKNSDLIILKYITASYRHLYLWNMQPNDKLTKFTVDSIKESAINLSYDSTPNFYMPIVPLNSVATIDQLGKKLQRNIRVKKRLLLKSGYGFDVIESLNEDVEQRITELHINRWANKGIESKLSSEQRKNFIMRISKYPKGFSTSFVIFTLTNRNSIIAYRLGFLEKTVYRDWLTSFDIDYSKYSPGLVLYSEILTLLSNKGFTKFDFLRGDEDYKRQWSSSSQQLITLNAILK